MAVKDYKTNPDENTTISGINIAEGCPPSGINNAIRQLMADVKQNADEQSTEFSKVMTGATASAAGTSGNVPKPSAGDQNKPLTGGGTYANSIDCAASSLSSMFLDSTFQDNPDWWRSKGNSIFAVSKPGVIHNQPNQHGTIINTVVGGELQQIFIVQPEGKDFYTRGANFDGWNGSASDNGTWHKISNSMPVGSVYVQFSGQSAPADIFGCIWSNISWMYAGLFFRAEGDAAAAFGGSQSGGLPNATGSVSLINFNVTPGGYGALTYTNTGGNAGRNNESKYRTTGTIGLDLSKGNGLFGAASEVRPINSTIRIWKRTA